jgi:hypothetical protein
VQAHHTRIRTTTGDGRLQRRALLQGNRSPSSVQKVMGDLLLSKQAVTHSGLLADQPPLSIGPKVTRNFVSSEQYISASWCLLLVHRYTAVWSRARVLSGMSVVWWRS